MSATLPRLLDAKAVAGELGVGPCVYVVETDAGVKIGITVDLPGRIDSLEKCGGGRPRLVRAFPMASRKHARIIEAWAHDELAADRTVGEWFVTHPIVAADAVAALVRRPPECLPLPHQTRTAIARWLERQGVAA